MRDGWHKCCPLVVGRVSRAALLNWPSRYSRFCFCGHWPQKLFRRDAQSHFGRICLDRARPGIVEYPKAFLYVFRHFRYSERPSHERDPRLFRSRLELRKSPKLPLAHFNLSDPLLKHPITNYAQTGLFSVPKHCCRQDLFHQCCSSWLRADASKSSSYLPQQFLRTCLTDQLIDHSD